MFEKFGELNSFGEINELAENLFNEGDTESLRAMTFIPRGTADVPSLVGVWM